jgi:hypothetical protein
VGRQERPTRSTTLPSQGRQRGWEKMINDGVEPGSTLGRVESPGTIEGRESPLGGRDGRAAFRACSYSGGHAACPRQELSG